MDPSPDPVASGDDPLDPDEPIEPAWLTVTRAFALACQVAVALPIVSLPLLAIGLLLVGPRSVDGLAGLVLVPILAIGLPAGGYAWLLRRWWRTGRWRSLAVADLAVAAAPSLVGWADDPPMPVVTAACLAAAVTLAVAAAAERVAAGGPSAPEAGRPAVAED